MSAAVILGGISLGLQVFGSLFGGDEEEEVGRQRQAVANYNARLLEKDAEKVREVGFEQETDHRRAVSDLLGRQRAELGAAGVRIDEGSAERLQSDTISLGEIDAMRIRRSTESKATALEEQATISRMGGQADRSAGDTAKTASVLTAGTQFASGVYGLLKNNGY